MNSKTRSNTLRISIFLLLVVALLAGTATITQAAAQAAIPGDALYPVKTSIEQARLSLAQDAGVRAEMRMAFAEQRLDEIKVLIAEGRFKEVGPAVLAFETNINQAILELETLSQVDPARAARLALEITAALSRYAQALSVMAASAPASVQIDVTRALDTTHIVGGLEMPASSSVDNGNVNGDDGNTNDNGTGDNANINDDDGNGNGDDENANDNGDDDANINADDDNGNGDDNSNCNENENDTDCDDDGSNSNGDDSNSNGDDSNSNDDDSNSNGGDDGGSGGNDSGGDDDSGSGGSGGGDDDSGSGGSGGGDDDGGNGNG